MTEHIKKPPEQCETCKYWVRTHMNASSGECRRHSPVFWEECHLGGVFPKIDSYEYCGDYEEEANDRAH